jgi:AraC-like DNA-binding protein
MVASFATVLAALAPARTFAQESAKGLDFMARIPVAPPTVLGSLALMLVQALDARGPAGRAHAAGVGIDLAMLGDPNYRCPLAATTHLWRVAVEVTGDPCFGLWACRFTSQTTFHALGFAAFASQTLREAFERFARYSRLVSDVAEIQLRRVGQREQVRFVPLEGQPQPAAEAIDATLCLIVRMARMLSAGKVSPLAVRLERPEPSFSEPFRKAFHAPVQFGQRENVLEFDAADLDEPLPTANAELAQQNDELVARYLARIKCGRVSNRLRSWLIEQLASSEPTAVVAARALGMSLRNLQRRLQEEGMTYREALSSTREAMARAYLEERRASITDIALVLGFSGSSSFSRAFRRWTGQSPSAYSREETSRRRR